MSGHAAKIICLHLVVFTLDEYYVFSYIFFHFILCGHFPLKIIAVLVRHAVVLSRSVSVEPAVHNLSCSVTAWCSVSLCSLRACCSQSVLFCYSLVFSQSLFSPSLLFTICPVLLQPGVQPVSVLSEPAVHSLSCSVTVWCSASRCSLQACCSQSVLFCYSLVFSQSLFSPSLLFTVCPVLLQSGVQSASVLSEPAVHNLSCSVTAWCSASLCSLRACCSQSVLFCYSLVFSQSLFSLSLLFTVCPVLLQSGVQPVAVPSEPAVHNLSCSVTVWCPASLCSLRACCSQSVLFCYSLVSSQSLFSLILLFTICPVLLQSGVQPVAVLSEPAIHSLSCSVTIW